MHDDLRFIEANVLGLSDLANRGRMSADERIDKLAQAVHDLVRVVGSALEELDELGKARQQ